MTIQTTYHNAHENLAALMDRVTSEREIVIINRQGVEDVALISASEISSLLETAHLMRSPKNAQRLLKALQRAQNKTLLPQSLTQLRQEMGLNEQT